MPRFRDYSIPKKLTWMNLLVSGTALLLASTGFFAYDLFTIFERAQWQPRNPGADHRVNSISALLFDDPHSAKYIVGIAGCASRHVRRNLRARTPGFRKVSARWQWISLRPCQFPPASHKSTGSRCQVALVRSITFQGKPVARIYIRSICKP